MHLMSRSLWDRLKVTDGIFVSVWCKLPDKGGWTPLNRVKCFNGIARDPDLILVILPTQKQWNLVNVASCARVLKTPKDLDLPRCNPWLRDFSMNWLGWVLSQYFPKHRSDPRTRPFFCSTPFRIRLCQNSELFCALLIGKDLIPAELSENFFGLHRIITAVIVLPLTQDCERWRS